MRKIIVSLLALSCMVLMLAHPQASLSSARDALILWFEHVVPALLPFFVLTALLTNSGALHSLAPKFAPLTRLFGLPGESGLAIILGAVSGYPMGAVVTGRLMKDGMPISSAERSLLVSNFAGPMFIFGTVATSMLNHSRLGVPMLVSQYIGGFALALVIAFSDKPSEKEHSTPQQYKVETPQDKGVVSAFVQALGDGMPAMLRVGGAMTFFSALFASLESAGLIALIASPLEHMLSLLDLPHGTAHALLTGVVEMTGGCREISRLALSPGAAAALCVFLITLGGASICLQTLSFAPVRLGKYAAMRAIQGVIAAVICFFWVNNLAWPVMAASPMPVNLNYWPGSIAISILLLTVFALINMRGKAIRPARK